MKTMHRVTPSPWLIATCLALGACQQTPGSSSSAQALESSERRAAAPSETSDEDDQSPPPPPCHHHGPPPETITACADLAADAACSVTLPGPDGDHTIDGTCRELPPPPDSEDADGVIACVPTDMPPPHRHGHEPPEEAFTACADLAESADCSVTLGDRAIEGTCRQAHDSEALLCVPAHPPSPPPPPAAEAE